jgi:hypothetical protein
MLSPPPTVWPGTDRERRAFKLVLHVESGFLSGEPWLAIILI